MLNLDTHADRNIVVNRLVASHVVLTVRDKTTRAAIHAALTPEEAKAIAEALTSKEN